MQRREFLQFLGRSIAASAAVSIPSWAQDSKKHFKLPLFPSSDDRLLLAEGFQWDLLIGWGDAINPTEKFGFNCDFIGFIPDKKNPDEAFLFVNHESPNPLFTHGKKLLTKNKDHIIAEQKEVGGSLLRLRRQRGKWNVVKNHTANRRYDGTTPIPFTQGIEIEKSRHAIGTLGNCGGGVTPWGSFLTCEENYDQYYGEVKNSRRIETACVYDWQKVFQHPPQHYGWVVEIDPKSGSSKKLVSLGRFAHEAALVTPTKDGRTAVYMADDANDQHIYKFISSKPNTLEEGQLFVANTEKGEWLSLDVRNVSLKNYKSQTEIMIYARDAAKILGATPLDRPEDMDRDPITGAILVALTNNKPKNRPHGSLLKIVENDNNPLSMGFKASTFLLGGDNFSCPDNVTFDRNGNLWIAVDMAGSEMHKPPYEKFKNNGLFVIPVRGPNAGQVVQIASAPKDAELTGPCFSDDQRTLFLSVQHPGETTVDYAYPTSHWPDGKGKTPRPSVVTITGPSLWALTS